MRWLTEIWRVIRGAISPVDWLLSLRPPVESGLSNARAVRCISCPRNGKGPLTQWFTKRTARVLQRVIERRVEHGLSTWFDGGLGVCEACYCPLKLKVHEPIDLVVKDLSPGARAELWPKCWILLEEKEMKPHE